MGVSPPMHIVRPDAVTLGRSPAAGAVTLTGIAKQFGAVTVLHGIDLDIQPGEFITILGPSGCGKSTLLRIIAGLERQTSGCVTIDGTVVDELRPDERDIAMVFQSYALYPHLSVFENIAVPLRMRRLSAWQRLPGATLMPGVRRTAREIALAVHAVAKTLRIEGLLQRKPGQLSGGQKQRVALARAMVRQPRAFLMDEPLSNLDAELRVHMRAEIAQLHQQLGTTFIYVTHDQAEAMTMSDRIVLIVDGAPLQIGSPDAIFGDPDDLRVAQFMGTPHINVLPAVATSRGIDVLGTVLPLPGGIVQGTRLQVGIRPGRLTTATGEPSVTGRLAFRENLGSDMFLHVEVEGVETPLVARCDPSEAGSYRLGGQVRLAIASQHAFLFGIDGRRIRTAPSGGMEGAHA